MAKKQEKSPAGSKRRKILLVAGVVLLVLLAGGAGVALRWWQDMSQPPESSQMDEEELPTLPPVVDDLQSLRNEGNEDQFDQELATALENPDYDDSTRALLYIQQGNAAYDNKDFNAALESYLQAEELEQSSQTAQLVGFAYQELGNNTKAIEYYELTIERFSPDNVLYDAEKAYFEDRINQLRG